MTPADASIVWPVYDTIFGGYPTLAAWRGDVWDKHIARAGFRLARAYQGQSLVGFAYGYTGEPGQWWTDNARTVLAPDVAKAWLGGHFELVELAVLPEAQGHGIGAGLLDALLASRPEPRVLLQAHDGETAASRLYSRAGFARLVELPHGVVLVKDLR